MMLPGSDFSKKKQTNKQTNKQTKKQKQIKTKQKTTHTENNTNKLYKFLILINENKPEITIKQYI